MTRWRVTLADGSNETIAAVEMQLSSSGSLSFSETNPTPHYPPRPFRLLAAGQWLQARRVADE